MKKRTFKSKIDAFLLLVIKIIFLVLMKEEKFAFLSNDGFNI